MINNLFSSFDPATAPLPGRLNWGSSIIGISFLPLLFWHPSSRWWFLWLILDSKLHKEFETLLANAKAPGTTLISVRLFWFICFNNVLGLLPYVFTGTRHIAITIALSLPFWIAIMLYGWINNTEHILAHLVPLGTPGPLSPLMVLIESIRNLIRPGTLAIRLAANIIAGHLLITLMRRRGPHLHTLSGLSLVTCQRLLLSLELAVAFIQAFVFSALITLYASE